MERGSADGGVGLRLALGIETFIGSIGCDLVPLEALYSGTGKRQCGVYCFE